VYLVPILWLRNAYDRVFSPEIVSNLCIQWCHLPEAGINRGDSANIVGITREAPRNEYKGEHKVRLLRIAM